MVIFWVFKTNKTKKTPSQHSLTTITRERTTPLEPIFHRNRIGALATLGSISKLPLLKRKVSSERNLKLATTKIWWTDLPKLMSGLPTSRDGGLHRRSWLASRGISFPFLTCTLTTFLRLRSLVQRGVTFVCASWRLMSTWQCGVTSMVAFGVANSSFTQYLFHTTRKSAHAWLFVVSTLADRRMYYFFFPRRLQLISRIPAVQVKET